MSKTWLLGHRFHENADVIKTPKAINSAQRRLNSKEFGLTSRVKQEEIWRKHGLRKRVAYHFQNYRGFSVITIKSRYRLRKSRCCECMN